MESAFDTPRLKAQLLKVICLPIEDSLELINVLPEQDVKLMYDYFTYLQDEFEIPLSQYEQTILDRLTLLLQPIKIDNEN